MDVAGARTQSGSPSTSFDLMANLPIVAGKAAVRFVGYSAVDGGYVDDVNLRLSNVDRTLRYGGRLATKVRAGNSWTIAGNAAFQHLESNDTQYTTMTKLQRANRVREAHKNNFSEVGLTVTHTGNWIKLQSSTAYVRHDFSSLYDASAALSLFDSGEADLGVFREAAKINMTVQDIFLTPRNPGRLDWLIGAFASHTVEGTPSILRAAGGPPGLPPSSIYAEERTDRQDEGALYGEISYKFGQHWTASLGARVFASRLHAVSQVVVPLPSAPRDFDGSKNFNGVSPKFSVQYSLGPGELIYALASQGYRAGGFNTAGRSAPAPTRRTYSPDRLENYEIGAKLSPFGGKLDLRTALFYARWSDIQTDQYFNEGHPPERQFREPGRIRPAGDSRLLLRRSGALRISVEQPHRPAARRAAGLHRPLAPHLRAGPRNARFQFGDGRDHHGKAVGPVHHPTLESGRVHHQSHQRPGRHLLLRQPVQFRSGAAGNAAAAAHGDP